MVRPTTKDQAWASIYKHVSDPDTAEEVIALLGSDPKAREAHTALYLLARRAVRKHQGVVHRRATALRLLGKIVFAIPRAVRSWFRTTGDAIAVEMHSSSPMPGGVPRLSPPNREPAQVLAERRGSGASPEGDQPQAKSA